MPTEADTRIIIDRLLREARWNVENKSVVSTEEPAADGRADYLLKNSRTQPLAVVEAKRFSTDAYSAKEQAKAYAISLAAPFILLSNGREHYFWDCPHASNVSNAFARTRAGGSAGWRRFRASTRKAKRAPNC